MVFLLIRQHTWTMQEFFFLINLGEIYSEETIERLKWNLIYMFLSMLVLWCRSEMTDSRGHGLHRDSMKKRFIFFRTTEQILTIFGKNSIRSWAQLYCWVKKTTTLKSKNSAIFYWLIVLVCLMSLFDGAIRD
jgi:hypothetical protein